MLQNSLFLKMNRRLWNISDMIIADKRREGEGVNDSDESEEEDRAEIVLGD